MDAGPIRPASFSLIEMKLAVSSLVICVAALLGLGMVMLYSANMTSTDGARLLLKQSIWCGLGLVACIAMASLDYSVLRKLTWPLMAVSIILLVLVFVPHIGKSVKGAHRWITLGGFQLQPSELGKFALLVAIAWYCERYQRQMQGWKRGIFIPALIIAPSLGLIFIEPDRGSTMLMCAVLSVMLLFAGIRWYCFVVPAVLGIVGLVISFIHDPMRSARIYSWLNLEETKAEVGHQAYQASLAFGSGGWSGLGLGNGRQKMGFIPEHHTDFIFSIIGEELGIIATLLVVLAFLIFVISGVFISMRSRDAFGMLLGCGITFLIGLQAAINIGVVTGTLPNKGMPLPFISYGGSNLLMLLGCVGVLISIARHARERVEKPDAFLAPDNPFSPRAA